MSEFPKTSETDATARPGWIRRNVRLLIVLFLLPTATVLIAGKWWWSQEIGGQVEHIGGTFRVVEMEGVFARIENWIAGRESQRAHWVYLEGSDVDDTWLRDHREQLASLDYLYLGLGWTEITDEGLAHLRDMDNIMALNVSGTEITDAGLQHVSTLTSTSMLIAAQTEVTISGIETISTMPMLMHLEIQGADLSGDDLEVLARFHGLSTLGIDASQPGDSGTTKLRDCEYLTDLRLSNATDESVMYLENLNSLQQLMITGTNVTDESIPALSNLEDLLFLDLTGTSISDEGFQSLREALPRCQISRPEHR